MEAEEGKQTRKRANLTKMSVLPALWVPQGQHQLLGAEQVNLKGRAPRKAGTGKNLNIPSGG